MTSTTTYAEQLAPHADRLLAVALAVLAVVVLLRALVAHRRTGQGEKRGAPAVALGIAGAIAAVVFFAFRPIAWLMTII